MPMAWLRFFQMSKATVFNILELGDKKADIQKRQSQG
jgi:hypothetical protein